MITENQQKSVILLGFFVIYAFYSISVVNIPENTMFQEAEEDFSDSKSTERENKSSFQYIVNNSGCKIIEMDPFGWPVEKYSRFSKLSKCEERGFFKINGQKLQIKGDALQKWWNKTGLSCCFQDISRVEQSPDEYNETADWGIRYSSTCQSIPINGDNLLINNSYIRVKCKEDDDNGTETTELHGIVLPPQIHSKITREKASYWEKRAKRGLQKPPNILVLGIDSVSRLHMIRKMPQTRKYLFSNDFIEMKGYTRIGGYTFVNIMGGFAGLKLNKYKHCWANQSSKLDDCPYIWKGFNKMNYITAYIEDAPGISIFHSAKIGFVQQPTDYYAMTLMVAAHLRNGYGRRHGGASCIGGQQPVGFHTDFITDFVSRVGKEYPYFLFSWLTSLSHSSFNNLQNADDLFVNLLSNVTNNTVTDADNTIIIFMSDHGSRYGDFRESFLGFFEENLPFFFIRLPKSLKTSHPEWYTNLKRNGGQLTSSYDLHSTFLQIEKLASDLISNDTASNNVQTQTLSLSSSLVYRERYSFFEYIPDNRTCESALISDKYCMCGVTQEKQASKLYAKYVNVIVAHVNYLLKSAIELDGCVKLTFSKFLYGRQVGQAKQDNNEIKYTDHLLAVEASPSKAHFEGRLRIWPNGSSVILGDVDRINKYEGQSECTSETKIRPLCMCKSALQFVLKK